MTNGEALILRYVSSRVLHEPTLTSEDEEECQSELVQNNNQKAVHGGGAVNSFVQDACMSYTEGDSVQNGLENKSVENSNTGRKMPPILSGLLTNNNSPLGPSKASEVGDTEDGGELKEQYHSLSNNDEQEKHFQTILNARQATELSGRLESLEDQPLRMNGNDEDDEFEVTFPA